MTQSEICSGCNGKGYVPCRICDGKGKIIKKEIPTGQYFRTMGKELEIIGDKPVECQTCQGTGRLLCKMCGGVGKLLLEKPKSGWI